MEFGFCCAHKMAVPCKQKHYFGYVKIVIAQTIDKAVPGNSWLVSTQSKGVKDVETMSLGLKWCRPPGETWWSHSFWLSGLLLILSAIASKVQEDVWEWIIDFHLHSDWRFAAYFQVTPFIFMAIKTNIHLIYLCELAPFMINCICETTNLFLVIISKRATAERILASHQNLETATFSKK